MEVAHSNKHEITNVSTSRGGVLFHANMYLHLKVDQTMDYSSVDREARVSSLPLPTSSSALLSILGDTVPGTHGTSLYQQGQPSGTYTLHTALYNLDGGGSATIFAGNPLRGDALYTLSMTDAV